VSTLDHTLEPKAGSVRRLGVITGTGRRRRFSDEQGADHRRHFDAGCCGVGCGASAHGLSPQQLFTWRREARRRPVAPEAAPVFVPAVIHETGGDGGDKANKKVARRRRARQTHRGTNSTVHCAALDDTG
jgi:transposase